MKIDFVLRLLMLLAAASILQLEARRIGGDKARLSQADSDSNLHTITTNEQYEVPLIETVNKLRSETEPVKRKLDRVLKTITNTSPNDKTYSNKEIIVSKGKKLVNLTPALKTIKVSNNSIHVSGSVVLVKNQLSSLDIVQYEVDCIQTVKGGNSSVQSRVSFTDDFISRQSHVKLYVSTSKTIDRQLAFSKFLIKIKRDSFPLSFHIHVKLPNQTQDDTTLYFFVYVTDSKTHLNTFIPAGTSQILLQGTNRLEQKLDIYVKANGTEIIGAFQGRYGQRSIQPDTVFQVVIIPERSLPYRHNQTFDKVAQLSIQNASSTYPVPFTFLILNHILKSDEKYYAIAYIIENGIQRSINQEPILVVDKKKVFVTSPVIFNVIPQSFIVYGTVTRSGPGSYNLQPRSSLVLQLHEIGSNAHDIIFKLANIAVLPQIFQINISQSNLFDPSKSYDMNAFIIDDSNSTYMTNLQAVSLVDNYANIVIPVDDVLYYFKAELQSLSNPKFNFIPGSSARIYVTEDPDMSISPIMTFLIDSIPEYFQEFSFKVPVASIKSGLNYYLVLIIENNGIITHMSKTLLVLDKQLPPPIIKLPVPAANLITGVIVDIENRPAQWSSSSYAILSLFDEQAQDLDHEPVQIWEISLENNFPIRFEIEIDFSRIRSKHAYLLRATILSGRHVPEYESTAGILALNPYGGIFNNIRIPVHRVKRFQSIEGLIYVNNVNQPLPDTSEIILQLSSSPSLTHPNIIDETSIKLNGRTLPVNFTLNLPLNKLNINSLYYFLAQYVVRNNVVIPASELFPVTPRNETKIILRLSKPFQTLINGSVTSTNSPLILPSNTSLHLYISDSANHTQIQIYSEVLFRASSNNIYNFRMNIDSNILQRKTPVYLHANILYEDKIIVRMPKPALLEITPDGEWNINLVVDLPTLLIGRIVTKSKQETINDEFDAHIEILESNTTNIVHKSQFNIGTSLPEDFLLAIDNDLFDRYKALQARAFIKNCKGFSLFEPVDALNIHRGFNVKLNLPVLLTNRTKLQQYKISDKNNASLHTGVWRLSVTGITNVLASNSENNVHREN